MKKIFDKNEVTFAVIMIVIYVIGSSLMMNLSELIGIQFLAESAFDLVLAAVIFVFIRKNGLMQYLGLCKSSVPASKMLFYIPLIVVGAFPAFFGAGLSHGPLGMVLHTVMMILVGFLEEVIFRGFLFKGIAKQNLTRAVIVSAVTFGVGHIVNLIFNRYDIFGSVTQIIYAVAVGFMLVFIFMRTGSIIACIAFHGFNNAMTAFSTGEVLKNAVGSEQTAEMIMLAAMVTITLLYTLYVAKAFPKRLSAVYADGTRTARPLQDNG